MEERTIGPDKICQKALQAKMAIYQAKEHFKVVPAIQAFGRAQKCAVSSPCQRFQNLDKGSCATTEMAVLPLTYGSDISLPPVISAFKDKVLYLFLCRNRMAAA